MRIVDGSVTDVQEATALSRHKEKVAVFSASWGPKDDGAHLEGPGKLARIALQLGVERVRLLTRTVALGWEENSVLFICVCPVCCGLLNATT